MLGLIFELQLRNIKKEERRNKKKKNERENMKREGGSCLLSGTSLGPSQTVCGSPKVGFPQRRGSCPGVLSPGYAPALFGLAPTFARLPDA